MKNKTGARRNKNYFSNTGRLTRFIFRRERVMSSVWVFCLTLFSIIVAFSLYSLFGTDAERMVMAETMKNPAMVALMGPVYTVAGPAGEELYSLGAMMANEMLLIMAIVVAVMNIFLVTRHTRADEEAGRAEVIRSLPAGRLSNLAGTMLTALAVNGSLALLTGFGLAALGFDGMGFGGSMLYGAALGVSGLFFAAVTAVFSQLSSSPRGAAGLSFAVLAFCYLIRAVGDISAGAEALAYISPLGLMTRSQVYVKNLVWPPLVVLALSALCAGAAFYLNAARDLGQGFIHARPGRKTASAALKSPLGLAFRLVRNALTAWAAGLLAFGLMYGSVMGDMETFIENNEFLKQILPAPEGSGYAEMFLSMVISVMSILATVPVLTAALKLRAEEKAGRGEFLAAAPVSRAKLLAGYFAIAAVSSVIMLFAGAFGLWAASSLSMKDPIPFGAVFKMMMVYLPAVFVMLGLAVFLTGLAPRYTNIVFGYLGFSLFAVYLGKLLSFPDWTAKLSPYGWIPRLPEETVNYIVLAVLVCFSAVLAAAGFVFYKKRDI